VVVLGAGSAGEWVAGGVALIRGTGRITGAGVIDVDGRQVGYRDLVVATGSRPAVPSIEGLDQVAVWTSDQALSAPAQVKAMETAPGGRARALLDGGPVIETEQVILAVGRTPATAGLGLDAIGITPTGRGTCSSGPLPSGPGLMSGSQRPASRFAPASP
jgi:pyruvate/2-oxoglutarate dehydrogenase complex dihydrolipoamide dehydrogenase (E3) component